MLLATEFVKDRFDGQIFRKPGVLTTRNHCCQNQNIPVAVGANIRIIFIFL